MVRAQLELLKQGHPVDSVFYSLAGDPNGHRLLLVDGDGMAYWCVQCGAMLFDQSEVNGPSEWSVPGQDGKTCGPESPPCRSSLIQSPR